MTEEFLYYLWRNRLLHFGCKTTDGRELEIIKTGERNSDAGPDFINAKIKIGKTIWAGNVEIHVNSSDWEKHNHSNDKSYKNVILHVVYNHDKEIYYSPQYSHNNNIKGAHENSSLSSTENKIKFTQSTQRKENAENAENTEKEARVANARQQRSSQYSHNNNNIKGAHENASLSSTENKIKFTQSTQRRKESPQATDDSPLKFDNLLDREIIPCLELKGKYDEKLFENYKNIINSKNPIPCSKLIKNVNSLIIRSWMEALLAERLENKTELVSNYLKRSNNNYEQCFYLLLARNFGFKLNSDAFELLANQTSYEVFPKHRDSLFQIEALLFGQSGLLDKEFRDDYPNQLKKEYKYLKQKFSLKPVEGQLWKFLRLRPANFPTIRIAQFAYLIHKNDSLLSKVLNVRNIKTIKDIFDIKTSEYWETHYIFDKENKRKVKSLGNSSVENIIINTIVPFLFIYGIKKDNFAFREKAIKLLEQLPAESNRITKMWNECGINAENAFDSQSLIELNNEYCSKLRCLDCRIGSYIMNNE